MVPKYWTFPEQCEGWVKQVGASEAYHPGFPIFLDGSGGDFTKDPRLRRCGWAWIQYEPANDLPDHVWGQFGALGGKQTAPRAETQALAAALRIVAVSPRIHEVGPDGVLIYTDKLGVWRRAQQVIHGRLFQ